MNPDRLSGYLHPTPPFRLPARIPEGRPHQVTPHRDGVRLQLHLNIDGRPLLATVRAVGTPRRPVLAWELTAAHAISEAIRYAALERLVRILDLHAPRHDFLAAAALDPPLQAVLRHRGGAVPIRAATVFEAVVIAVIRQHHPHRSGRCLTRLATHFGAALPGAPGQGHAFPAPSAFLKPSLERLAALSGSRELAWRLQVVASGIEEGGDARLMQLSSPALGAWLGDIAGLDAAAVRWLLIRDLGRNDPLPAPDSLLDQGLRAIYGPLNGDDYLRLTARYRPWSSIWDAVVRMAGEQVSGTAVTAEGPLVFSSRPELR